VGESEEYLSIDEVGQLLGRSRPVVFNRIKRHNILTFRRPPDRRTLIRRSDLDALRQTAPVGDPILITKKRGSAQSANRQADEPE
jgi:hypothetical protein